MNGKEAFTNKKIKKEQILLLLILLLGMAARIWQFGTIPGDINQDEAFAGYEAFSLLRYGKDSAGYAFPVYLVAWGSGMNVLNSILMIPFIALFGLKTWVIRVPQLLTAVLTLYVVYRMIRELDSEKFALWCTFFLAAAPWHIMLARWGLESNLAPGFLIFGLYFFIIGMNRPRYYVVSAVLYGLSLYTYATIWPIVPLLLLMQLILAWHIAPQSLRSKPAAAAVIVLALLAAPLLLFLLVNSGHMNEIRLPFLSIPRLVYMRGSQISLQHIPENFRHFLKMLLAQSDGLIWNAIPGFGIMYRVSLFFLPIGLVTAAVKSYKGWKEKKLCVEAVLLIQLAGAVVLALLIDVNINRINCIWIPIILITASGIYHLCSMVNRRMILVPVLLYLLLFARFEKYYFVRYEGETAAAFSYGLENAMREALSHEGTIYVSRSASYARVLFYAQQDVNEYIDTVVYTNYPSSILDVSSFGRFSFDIDAENPDQNGVYILDRSVDTTAFEENGFEILESGIYRIARIKK